MHHVVHTDASQAAPRPGYPGCDGYAYLRLVDRSTGSVHMVQGLSFLQAGGQVSRHLHSNEETFYILQGKVTVTTDAVSHELQPGDYGFFPVGTHHSWHNTSSSPVRWLELASPQPTTDGRRDTFFTGEPAGAGSPPNLADPRVRHIGHWTGTSDVAEYTGEGSPIGMDIGVSLSAPGIWVKELVNDTLGASLTQLIMVELEPGAGMHGTTHDHPFEEAFLLLDGEVDGILGAEHVTLRAGDAFWAGVATPHGWHNASQHPVRWLESQCPQPPTRHKYRWTPPWEAVGRSFATP